jgi:hypothetical protein
MDNARSSLDLEHFDDICLYKDGTSKHKLGAGNRHEGLFLVPVIAVFTKYDQFKRNIMMRLEDEGRESEPRDPTLLNAEVENVFKGQYLAKLRESAPFVRLEGENSGD